MIKPVTILAALLLVATCSAFVQPAARSVAFNSKTRVNMFGEDGPERPSLTRDNEPDEFFSTNMDKMSDAEKLPIALGGLAFISLPFIAGLIALYSAK
mmetsp:Transcript_2112/g.2562  ORF Transcript_2112/g.2562 Transcript_2112/m.2562 type:complete len:98 (+) Transcript_2112:87-380(+)|eukprot:CAMPEP_0195256632 /NCGR_PEP_ID=MMETSP0706-20130129/6348_1 /TAXON_ID=33640 /ORGANISM="Asterionellopsis glacialis, Strain CCMP134" /LENGTH=97 /DNA_ID=CAMNT_0040309705 /DNA_START=149 /DNA_END=442 /DNA_ORIENTATION=+